MQYHETAAVDHPGSKATKNCPQVDDEPAWVSQERGASSGNTYFGHDMPKSPADNVLQSTNDPEYGEFHTGYGHQTSPHSLAGMNFVHAMSNDLLYNLEHHRCEYSSSLTIPELLFDDELLFNDEFWPDESRPDYSSQGNMTAFNPDMPPRHDEQHLPRQQYTTVVDTEQLHMNAVAPEPWTTYSAGYPGQIMTNVHGELVSTYHGCSTSSRYTSGPSQELMSVRASTDMADETTNTSCVLDPAGMGDSIITVKPLDRREEPCMSRRSESVDHDNLGEEWDIDSVDQNWNPGDDPPIPDDPNAVGPDTPHELSCSASGCNIVFHGQYRSGNQKRHMRLKHGHEERSYACASKGCNKSFKRPDARLKHYRTRHPELLPPQKLSRKRARGTSQGDAQSL